MSIKKVQLQPFKSPKLQSHWVNLKLPIQEDQRFKSLTNPEIVKIMKPQIQQDTLFKDNIVSIFMVDVLDTQDSPAGKRVKLILLFLKVKPALNSPTIEWRVAGPEGQVWVVTMVNYPYSINNKDPLGWYHRTFQSKNVFRYKMEEVCKYL